MGCAAPKSWLKYTTLVVPLDQTFHPLHVCYRDIELAKVPHHGFLAQRFTMAGSEPLFQEADPLHSKLNVEYECWYKMVPYKKNMSLEQAARQFKLISKISAAINQTA